MEEFSRESDQRKEGENTAPVEIKLGEEVIRMENHKELAPNQMHGEWIVEVPTDFNLEEFAELLDKVLSEALKECSPAIKGLHGMVKFLDSIDATPPPNMTPAGRATFFTSSDGKEHLILIRISKEALQLACKLSPYIPVSHQALQICLHEIFESDYHLNKDSKISIYNPKHPKYRNSDQEVKSACDYQQNFGSELRAGR